MGTGGNDRRWVRRGVGLLAAAGAALTLASCEIPGPHTVITVNRFVDGNDAAPGNGVCEISPGLGNCSLRAAIDEANATTGNPPRIVVPSGTYTLTDAGTDDNNAGGDLDINPVGKRLLIEGQGAGAVIDANGADHALDAHGGLTVAKRIAVTDASASGVTARTSTVVELQRSSAHDNAGAGLEASTGGVVSTINTTVSGNGGGGVTTTGTFIAVFTTVTDNTGGGVTGTGEAHLRSTIVGDQATGDDCAEPVSSEGDNLDSDGTCGLDQATDLSATAPVLGPLTADALPHHVPQPASPAIDSTIPGTGVCGTTGSPTIDQTGGVRPYGSGCDRGAIEAGAPVPLTVNSALDIHDANPGDGACDTDAPPADEDDCTLRAAVDETNATAGPGAIVIAAGVDPVLSLAGFNDDANASGDLDVTDDLTLVGGGATLDAAGLDRVFHVPSGDALDLHNVTLTGGFAQSDGGGVLLQTGSVDVWNTTIRGNTASGNGGGLANRDGTLTVQASTLHTNRAIGDGGFSGSGGGVVTDDGDTDIVNSTLDGNIAAAGSAVGTGAPFFVNLSGTTDIAASTIAHNQGGPAVMRSTFFICNLGGCSQYTAGPIHLEATALLNLGGDCSGTLTSGGYNRASSAGCPFTGPGDATGVDPFLGPLDDNGGPTSTNLPYSNSPLLNAIPSGTSVLCDGTIPTDQRGVGRPAGPACDIGAVEGNSPIAAVPADFVVDTTADVPDAQPGDGVCATASETCSLRAAVDESNAWPPDDTIHIAPGIDPTLTITDDESEDANASGDLDLNDVVSIDGDGATVRAAPGERVIDVIFGGLTLEDATITGGNATGSGGGIESGLPLELTDVELTGNHASGDGGGVRAGALVMTGGGASGNSAGAQGGGLWSSSGSLDGVTLTANTAGNQGGGARVGGTVTDAVVEGNVAFIGGGLAVNGGTVSSSTIEGNTAGFGGGGVLAAGTVTITDTSIEGNQATNPTWGSGGGVNATGDLTIERSTIADNQAVQDGGGVLGGTNTTLRNVTVSGNTAGDTGGGIAPLGPLSVGFSTIAHNAVTGESSHGAGIGTNSTYPIVYVAGSILDNFGEDCWALSSGSLGYNVLSSVCGPPQPTDQVNVRSRVEPLADNGGPGQTNMPFADSPAINAIPAGTPSFCDGGVPTDERGVTRPSGGACDIGAVEGHNGIVATPRSFTVDDASDAPDGDPTDGLCDAGGGTCTLRAAIDEANIWPAADTITIEPGVNPLLTIPGADEAGNASGDLNVFDSVTIDGNGATIDGNHLDRVLRMSSTAPVELRDLHLTGGDVPGFSLYNGGSIYTTADLTLDGVTVDGPTNKPLIRMDGTGAQLSVTDSWLDATGTSGAVYTNNGSVTATRSTISGGDLGIYASTADLVNVTVSDTAGTGVSAETATIRSSTIVGNPLGIAGTNVTATATVLANATDCSVTSMTSGGYNVAASGACGFSQPTDQLANPLVAPLADNGGPGPTHLLFANSPAVNAIPVGLGICDGTVPTDERGVARPVGPACDAGAVEGDNGMTTTPLALVVNSAADAPDADPGDGACATSGGVCTLRAAVDESNEATTTDSITIAPGVNPVLAIPGWDDDDNATGDLDITDSVALDGNGAAVDAAKLDRAFHVLGGTVSIEDVTVRNGYQPYGGAGITSVGHLTLSRVTVTGAGGFGNAAVTIAGGDALIEDTTIERNRFWGGGGSDHGGLDVMGNADVILDRSTIRHNATSGPSAGIYVADTAELLVRRSSIVGNATLYTNGAAIYRFGGTVTIVASTIMQNNTPLTLLGSMSVSGSIVMPGGGSACGAGPTSGGYNVVSDATCGFAAVGDQVSTDPKIGGLRSNGGPTPTALPFLGAPVLNAIPNGTVGLCDGTMTVDQRGSARPVGGACDIGSVEGNAAIASVPLSLTVNTAADLVDVAPGNGLCDAGGGSCSLRAAIEEANARVGLDTIAIAAGINPTLSRAGGGEDGNSTGDLDVTDDVTIAGSGNVISAAMLDRVLDLAGADVTITGVTLRDGRLTSVGSIGGGIRVLGGTLRLTQVTVRNNALTAASSSGGGIWLFAGEMIVDRSTLNSNTVATTTGLGGGVFQDARSSALFTNSTLSANSAWFGGAVYLESGGGGVNFVASTVGPNPGINALHGFGMRATGSVFVHNGTAMICGSAMLPTSWNIADDTSCGFVDVGDVQGVNPLLGALASNGGPTQTHLPGAGSLAINAIPAGTAGVCDGSVPIDQRGVARPTGGACDKGAVEQ